MLLEQSMTSDTIARQNEDVYPPSLTIHKQRHRTLDVPFQTSVTRSLANEAMVDTRTESTRKLIRGQAG